MQNLATTLTLVFLTAALPVPLMAQPTLEAIDQLAQDFVGNSTPGLGVLVTKDGAVLHMAGYGFANIENQTPITETSIFDLASVSKQMTALAARIQIEAAVYTEETPITAFLPVLDGIDSPRPLVVADLVYHMSGLTDYLDWEGYGSDTTNAEVLAWLADQPLDHDPGQWFDYSNTGYLTLGSLVAAADSSDDLAQVLKVQVWNPLQMNDTALPSPADPARRVTGYDGENGNFEVAMDPNVAEGDGNVFSTLADLAKYEAALAGSLLLDDTEALFQEGRFDDGAFVRDEDDTGYGYGWVLYAADGQNYATHSGSWTGTSTFYLRNLSTGVSVILLANGEAAELDELADEIAAAVE